MTLPRRAVGADLGERPSVVVALDEAVLAARVAVVARLSLVAELFCVTHSTVHRHIKVKR